MAFQYDRRLSQNQTGHSTVHSNGFYKKNHTRLREYYNVWENPKSQKESPMRIKYNLKGLTIIYGRSVNGSGVRLNGRLLARS